VSLLVLEGNLVLNFTASSHTDLGGPDLRLENLTTSADTAIGTAEAYLAELGAENHTLQALPSDSATDITALSDLCSALAFTGLSLASDQADWADGSDTTDRCHWNGSGEDEELWLSAEAVGPLAAGGMSAEELAQWWVSALPYAQGDNLGLHGDEYYASSVDPDTLDAAIPTRDFVIRFGNVVLEGRISAATDEIADDRLHVIAEQIASQTEGLLEAE